MMEKAVEQIQNSISGLKEMECALLGNIYRCRDRIPKENRQNIEQIARKIKAKSMSALAKCDIIKKGVQDTHKENNDLKRKILELEKQNKQQSREIALLNDELKMKEEEHLKTKAALRTSEDVLSDIISESFRDEFSNDEEEEKGQARKRQRVTDVKDETMN